MTLLNEKSTVKISQPQSNKKIIFPDFMQAVSYHFKIQKT
jgi:hypothetical protein